MIFPKLRQAQDVVCCMWRVACGVKYAMRPCVRASVRPCMRACAREHARVREARRGEERRGEKRREEEGEAHCVACSVCSSARLSADARSTGCMGCATGSASLVDESNRCLRSGSEGRARRRSEEPACRDGGAGRRALEVSRLPTSTASRVCQAWEGTPVGRGWGDQEDAQARPFRTPPPTTPTLAPPVQHAYGAGESSSWVLQDGCG